MAAPKRRSRLWTILVVLVVLALVAGGAYLAFGSRLKGAAGQAAAIQTGTVTSITAVSTVADSGSVAAQQSASVFWKTTGTVAEVLVQPGTHVQAGDILMRVDPLSAPGTVIQAESDLLAAQTALSDLQHPSALSLATAQQAVVTAQDTLTKAQRDLRYAQNPAGQSLRDTVDSTKLAFDTAQADAQLATVSQPVQDYTNAYWLTDYYWKRYQNLKAIYTATPNDQNLTAANNAHNDWQVLADQQAQRQLTFQTDQANKNSAVTTAQKAYNDAVNNLNAALKGPDVAKVAQDQANVDVAKASMADDLDKLAKMQAGGAPNDVKTDQARIQVDQATIDTLDLRAPFAGDVLVVNYQPGDAVSPTQSAVELANRSRYHIDVAVDESEVTNIAVGNLANVTFTSLPTVTLTGTVTLIEPLGQTVQGLVKYTVRVELPNTDPRVLVGMTANVSIVTATVANALAVPLDAVQLDAQGEYVNRVGAAGALERVPVVSGAVQGDLVLVTGNLSPGDKVQLVQAKPTSNGSPFGGGG